MDVDTPWGLAYLAVSIITVLVGVLWVIWPR